MYSVVGHNKRSYARTRCDLLCWFVQMTTCAAQEQNVICQLIVLPYQTGGPGGPTWTKPASAKTKTWATIFSKSSGEKIGRRQECCGSRIGWNGRGASSLKTRSDRMLVAFSVGERIREGKILFVVAADSLPEKVLCRGHYFQLSTKSFWSQAWSSWDEISQWLLSPLKCSSENLIQSTNLH